MAKEEPMGTSKLFSLNSNLCKGPVPPAPEAPKPKGRKEREVVIEDRERAKVEREKGEVSSLPRDQRDVRDTRDPRESRGNEREKGEIGARPPPYSGRDREKEKERELGPLPPPSRSGDRGTDFNRDRRNDRRHKYSNNSYR